jgi:hypothetical protein
MLMPTNDKGTAWLDRNAPPDEVYRFVFDRKAKVGISKDRSECKVYVEDHFWIPILVSTFDELTRSRLLQTFEGIQSPNKWFFEAAPQSEP